MIISLVPAILLTFWCSLIYHIYTNIGSPATKRGGGKRLFSGAGCIKKYWQSKLDSITREAAAVGVPWRTSHTLMLWLCSLFSAGILFLLTHNGLLFLSGWFLIGFLPSLMIQTKHRNQRVDLLENLVTCLRQILARIPDQGGLIRAMELTLQSGLDPRIDQVLREVIRDIGLGSGMAEALELWRHKINMHKFDHVIDTFLQAHAEGWSAAAMKALSKAIQAMESDLRAIHLARQKSRQRKRQLYLMILTAWSFPFILSLLNEGGGNIYQDTVMGKLLIFAYGCGSLWTIIKGHEYLSLNVDEL